MVTVGGRRKEVAFTGKISSLATPKIVLPGTSFLIANRGRRTNWSAELGSTEF